MKTIVRFLVVLLFSPFASADYFKLYTQVQVTPKIGNIVVTRGIAREPKYVDYMSNNREEMAEANIFPDADIGTFVENTVFAAMDDQKIEIIVHSDHRRMHGAGSAIADNYIEIKIDGKKVFESTFGDYRVQSEVYKIVLLPLEKIIFVYGHDSDPNTNDSSWPDTLWYDKLQNGEYFYLVEVGNSRKKEEKQSKSKPQFEDFPTTKYLSHSPIQPKKASSDDKNWQKRDWLEDPLFEPNFAGHIYAYVTGCGTNCKLLCFVDLRNGKLLDEMAICFSCGMSEDSPEIYKPEYRIDSRLLIVPCLVDSDGEGFHYMKYEDGNINKITTQLWDTQRNRAPEK